MLETVRQHTSQRHGETPDRESVRRRHCEYCLNLIDCASAMCSYTARTKASPGSPPSARAKIVASKPPASSAPLAPWATPPAGDQPIYDRLERDYYAPARDRHGTAGWHQAEQAGATLPYDQAIAYALEQSTHAVAPQANSSGD